MDRLAVVAGFPRENKGINENPLFVKLILPVKNKVLELSGINDAEVEIVWDPPWTQDMMSEEGKMELGLI